MTPEKSLIGGPKVSSAPFGNLCSLVRSDFDKQNLGGILTNMNGVSQSEIG
jgi:hypothetical protein